MVKDVKLTLVFIMFTKRPLISQDDADQLSLKPCRRRVLEATLDEVTNSDAFG